MVSAQIAGSLRVSIRKPDGTERVVKQAPIRWFSPQGTSEGLPVDKPDTLNFMPESADRGSAGYCIVLKFQPGAAATLDISDAYWYLPVRVNGNLTAIGNPANATGLGNDSFVNDYEVGDTALVANQESVICVLRAKEGVTFSVGGDKVNVSIENNA